ncbi:hypothetical protein HYV88_00755 [Candidatus Woesearchaeota archaeon]|nr:hypothetical protein [Candidatus Woesearchaeota archaeon]
MKKDLQFSIPPRTSFSKRLEFILKLPKPFQGGDYDIKLIAWIDGLEIRETLLQFKSHLNITKGLTLFKYWEKQYESELKINTLTRCLSYFNDKLSPMIIKSFTKKVIYFFLRLFNRR